MIGCVVATTNVEQYNSMGWVVWVEVLSYRDANLDSSIGLVVLHKQHSKRIGLTESQTNMQWDMVDVEVIKTNLKSGILGSPLAEIKTSTFSMQALIDMVVDLAQCIDWN